jgi:hypothetical protein
MRTPKGSGIRPDRSGIAIQGGTMFIRHASFILIPLFAAGCSAAETSTTEADTIETFADSFSNETFVDVWSYFTAPAEFDAWAELTSNLKIDFDAVCGDTFCEGDYANYESLGFRCSVGVQTGKIGKCVWVFAASNEEVVPSTGNIKVHAKTWRCKMPLKPATPISDFVQALSAPGGRPIDATLPGTNLSLYDGLADCL